METDMHSVPKLPICHTVLWHIHLCITDFELMNRNSNNNKNKCSQLPLEVFGHADTFDCQDFDIFASETCCNSNTTRAAGKTGILWLFLRCREIQFKITNICGHKFVSKNLILQYILYIFFVSLVNFLKREWCIFVYCYIYFFSNDVVPLCVH